MTDKAHLPLQRAVPAKRTLTVVLVALLLVFAGCLGGDGGGTTTEAATTEATTEETTTEQATTTEKATTTEAATTGEITVGTTTNGSGNTTLGITVENESGEPVDNATVEISTEDGGVLEGIFGDDVENPGAVGPNGQVTVELPNGNYTVEATADGFAPGARQVEINGTDANITLTLNATPPITATTQTLPGNATPLPNATPPGNQTAVPPGVPANGTPVGVETEYALNVTVEDASGAPVENASVQVSDDSGLLSGLFGENQDAGSVNSEGQVSVELTNGSYTVSAEADGFSDAEQDVEVNGSATNVTLALNETTTST